MVRALNVILNMDTTTLEADTRMDMRTDTRKQIQTEPYTEQTMETPIYTHPIFSICRSRYNY